MSEIAVIVAVVVSHEDFGVQFCSPISLPIQLLLLCILKGFWFTDVLLLYSRGAMDLVYLIGSLLGYFKKFGAGRRVDYHCNLI